MIHLPRKKPPNWSLRRQSPPLQIANMYGPGRHLKGREFKKRCKQLEKREAEAIEAAKRKGF